MEGVGGQEDEMGGDIQGTEHAHCIVLQGLLPGLASLRGEGARPLAILLDHLWASLQLLACCNLLGRFSSLCRVHCAAHCPFGTSKTSVP